MSCMPIDNTINPIIFDIAFKPASPIYFKMDGANLKAINILMLTKRMEAMVINI